MGATLAAALLAFAAPAYGSYALPAARSALTRGVTARHAAIRAQADAASTDLENGLLRLCALTDRGQRASESQTRALIERIEALERAAPPATVVDLNGEWRVLAAVGDSAYRSSPFFSAFRQATSKCVP